MESFFKGIVELVSGLSDDPSRGVGTIIVDQNNNILSYGSNTIPTGVIKDVDRVNKPNKYKWIEHSERNAIYSAAKRGISLDGSKMYCTYFPCCDCARAIIQSGIIELITSKPDINHEKWGESWNLASLMLEESGVKIRYI
tara:strand:+ start:13570 stop:13992 length:423 start_codon:yes stop_codon:yes gene_type:complete